MANRPMVFDSGYHMMYSLLDNVTVEQVEAEIPLLEKSIQEANSIISNQNNIKQVKASKLRTLKTFLERHENKKLHEEFVLTEDHKKIIKAINWENPDPYNYLYNDDVCKILGWEKPNDEYSTKQLEDATKLLKEVPIAVNRFFTGESK